MAKVRTGSGCSKWLKDRGFEPQPTGRKVAGVREVWVHFPSGKLARVGYELYTSTGQSSRGSGAVWGYTVTIED